MERKMAEAAALEALGFEGKATKTMYVSKMESDIDDGAGALVQLRVEFSWDLADATSVGLVDILPDDYFRALPNPTITLSLDARNLGNITPSVIDDGIFAWMEHEIKRAPWLIRLQQSPRKLVDALEKITALDDIADNVTLVFAVTCGRFKTTTDEISLGDFLGHERLQQVVEAAKAVSTSKIKWREWT